MLTHPGEEPQPVLFRRHRDGGVIALFPYLPAECLSPAACLSYMRPGRFGAADPAIVADTRPARPHEYATLKAELERIGYRLAVHHRMPSDAYARRKEAMHPLAVP